MSIHNTKRPLYHIWHIDAEDSPLGMMMENKEEGAHTTAQASGNCTKTCWLSSFFGPQQVQK
jgi:hypothetical protein